MKPDIYIYITTEQTAYLTVICGPSLAAVGFIVEKKPWGDSDLFTEGADKRGAVKVFTFSMKHVV